MSEKMVSGQKRNGMKLSKSFEKDTSISFWENFRYLRGRHLLENNGDIIFCKMSIIKCEGHSQLKETAGRCNRHKCPKNESRLYVKEENQSRQTVRLEKSN